MKINSNEVTERFQKAVRKRGIDMGLDSLSAIARHLGYEERTFRYKVSRLTFSYLELRDLFHRLHFTTDEIVKLLGE